MEQVGNVLNSFWADDRPGASVEELDSAEVAVGHVLPGGLRSLLMRCNGGVSQFSGAECNGEYFPMLPVLGVDANASFGTIMRACAVGDAFGVPDGVVVFAAQGEAWWGLDYREGELPAVVYRDSPAVEISHVAATFDALLQGLVE